MNLKDFLSKSSVGTQVKIFVDGEQQVLTLDFYNNEANKYIIKYWLVTDNIVHIEVNKTC